MDLPLDEQGPKKEILQAFDGSTRKILTKTEHQSHAPIQRILTG